MDRVVLRTTAGRRIVKKVLRWTCLGCGAKLPPLADRCPRCGEPT